MTAETEAERLLPCIQLQRCGVKNGIRHNPNCPAFYRARVTQFFVDRDAEIGRLRVALEDLYLSAWLLQQNSEGCAHQHHGVDFTEQGMPGWLSDTLASIERARSALAGETK